jgi:hypothetical protein
MPSVLLNNGMESQIDAQDAWVLGHLWSADWERHGLHAYARNSKLGHLHRVILDNPEGKVDHIDGDTLNNRRSNLRVVSNAENGRNRKGANVGSTTGVLGVYYRPARDHYQALIRVDGKLVYLGTFPTLELASEARLAGELKFWGIQPRRAHLHV